MKTTQAQLQVYMKTYISLYLRSPINDMLAPLVSIIFFLSSSLTQHPSRLRSSPPSLTPAPVLPRWNFLIIHSLASLLLLLLLLPSRNFPISASSRSAPSFPESPAPGRIRRPLAASVGGRSVLGFAGGRGRRARGMLYLKQPGGAD
jgi:hypothetical protein